MIEIRLTKCKLFLTEDELISLLAKDAGLWQIALKRGKGISRSRGEARRNVQKL